MSWKQQRYFGMLSSVHFPVETTLQAPKDPAQCWKEDLGVSESNLPSVYPELPDPLGFGGHRITCALLSFRSSLFFKQGIGKFKLWYRAKCQKGGDSMRTSPLLHWWKGWQQQEGALGMAYPTAMITCLTPRLPVFHQLSLGRSVQRDVSCKGKMLMASREGLIVLSFHSVSFHVG